MTKISNKTAYANEDPISEKDYMIGTNGDSDAKQTKTFLFGDIRSFVNEGLTPIIGGTLAITKYDYIGPLTTPFEVINQLDPNKSIMPYEVFIVSVNGTKYITQVQDRVVGDGQPPTNANDFILLASTAPDATTISKGILKLAGDLGGTADLPTTPTAIHKTGNESFTGDKTSSNGTLLITTTIAGVIPIAAGVSSSGGAAIKGSTFNSASYGVWGASSSANAIGIYGSNASSNGIGIYGFNGTSSGGAGIAVLANSGSSVTNGLNFVGQNNGANTFTVDKLGNIIANGNITANSFIKIGGLATQFLMANGDAITLGGIFTPTSGGGITYSKSYYEKIGNILKMQINVQINIPNPNFSGSFTFFLPNLYTIANRVAGTLIGSSVLAVGSNVVSGGVLAREGTTDNTIDVYYGGNNLPTPAMFASITISVEVN